MKRVVLVLGGGGLKGLSHIGAWKAIREAGIDVAEIVGTSIGAFVGAALAGGHDWGHLAPKALAMTKKDIVALNRWALLLNGIRQPSVFLGETFEKYVEATIPTNDWDAMRIPIGINAVDLGSGENVWFGAGGRTDVSPARAVYASCALPMFYPPAEIDGRLFVDGGVRETLAIDRAAERGADLIIAVDAASNGAEVDTKTLMENGMIAIHQRVFEIMSAEHRGELLAEWDGPPLVYVRPRLTGYATWQFDANQYFVEEGYRAARRALSAAGYPSAKAAAGSD